MKSKSHSQTHTELPLRGLLTTAEICENKIIVLNKMLTGDIIYFEHLKEV